MNLETIFWAVLAAFGALIGLGILKKSGKNSQQDRRPPNIEPLIDAGRREIDTRGAEERAHIDAGIRESVDEVREAATSLDATEAAARLLNEED